MREAIHIYRETGDRAGLARASRRLGSVLVFCGRFREAQPLLEESARLFKRLGHQLDLAEAVGNLNWVQMSLGMYEEARELFTARTALFQESGVTMDVGYEHLTQAQFALLEARETGSRASCETAHRFAEASVVAFREVEHPDEGLAWAELGFAAHCLGRNIEARQHLREALRSARDVGAVPVTVTALAHLAAILTEDEPERAVEVYALAKRHPYVGNSRLKQDLLESRVAAAAARLPPDVVRAARGQEEDWATAAEDWLRELGVDQTGNGF